MSIQYQITDRIELDNEWKEEKLNKSSAELKIINKKKQRK